MNKMEIKGMSTQLLRIDIDNAIKDLLPLFEVTEEELAKFKEPTIRRFLSPDEYPKHPRVVPAYSFLDNFFYFPVFDLEGYERKFSQAIIHHEVGHYIHHFVNPSMIEGIYTFLRTGERPPGHWKLSETVAEYGNLILGLRDYEDSFYLAFAETEKKRYDKYGPEFLPHLARITLEEAIKEGIIKTKE